MAGVKGAKWDKPISTSPTHEAAVRARIQAGVLMQRLQDHALGKVDMTPTQIQAANILLRKVVADRTETKTDMTIRDERQINEEHAQRVASEYAGRALTH